MKFTLDCLHDHLETGATLDIICDTLNRIGLEVEDVTDPAAKLAGFEVAEIVSTEQHPDADRLKICTVKSGQGEQKLVCGAPNARAGLKGILANEGAVIPANGMVLGKAKIRGVESRGMMCSLAELELSEDHDGIIELSEDAVIGTPAAEALGNNGFAIDPVIEIAITPNRPDCLVCAALLVTSRQPVSGRSNPIRFWPNPRILKVILRLKLRHQIALSLPGALFAV